MTKKDYLEKRNALITEAQGLIDAGDLDGYNAKEAEIKALDAEYQQAATAAANLAALQNAPVVREDVVNVAPGSGTATGVAIELQPQNEQKAYELAFAKIMQHPANVARESYLTADELALVDRVNADFRRVNAATQTTNEAALLIPETVRDGIWQEIGELHPIFADLRSSGALTFVMGDFTIIVEKAASLASDAAAYDEADEVGDDDTVSLGEINLTGCELAKAVTVSWKAKKMSAEAFLNYIKKKIAEKMGNTLAKWIVEGLGKPGAGGGWKAQPYGIAARLEAEAGKPQIKPYETQDEIDYQFMTGVMKLIKSGYLSGCSIYAKNDFIWDVLANITDEIGRPMFVADVKSGGVGRMFGLVVKEEDAIGAGEMLVANMGAGYAMNINENVSMYQEDHVKARKTDYMGYAIVDGDVVTTKAFAMVQPA